MNGRNVIYQYELAWLKSMTPFQQEIVRPRPNHWWCWEVIYGLVPYLAAMLIWKCVSAGLLPNVRKSYLGTAEDRETISAVVITIMIHFEFRIFAQFLVLIVHLFGALKFIHPLVKRPRSSDIGDFNAWMERQLFWAFSKCDCVLIWNGTHYIEMTTIFIYVSEIKFLIRMTLLSSRAISGHLSLPLL